MSQLIPLSSIFVDPSFNTRSFTAEDLRETMDSMDRIGLLMPVVVQPIADVPTYEGDHEYRLIIGFRRFNCAKRLQWPTINCEIRSGIPENEARLLNFSENLHRKEMTLDEESEFLADMVRRGIPVTTISKVVSKSHEWVSRRVAFANVPDWLQEYIRIGDFKLTELAVLVQKPEITWPALVRKTIAARRSGKPGGLKGWDYRRRVKTKNEVRRMVKRLSMLGCSPHLLNFAGWCLGNIEDARLVELIQDSRAFAGDAEALKALCRSASSLAAWVKGTKRVSEKQRERAAELVLAAVKKLKGAL